ncbi:hypothetical protein [Serinicoccus sediminis]|uniref:hypothetical protein n=1 Tax=Serinicoccus sediminis TaxID=2306021 RepID=UPI00101F62F4|nr:hypothetical protein [Serinicoccus sediminis]
MTGAHGHEPPRRQASGAQTFLAATRIDEECDDVSFPDALLLARLVLEHRGAAMPTRGKHAVTNESIAKRLTRLGLTALEENIGRAAGTQGRSAWTVRASENGVALVCSTLGIESPVPNDPDAPATEEPVTDASRVSAAIADTLPFDQGWAPEGTLPFLDGPEVDSTSRLESPETDGSDGPPQPLQRQVTSSSDGEAPVTNRRAEELWGLPDKTGCYLTAIVVHGDDMSEEDYSKVGNHQLGALSKAARAYGEPPSWHVNKHIVGSQWADPLVAALTDGTLIAAGSTSRRGAGYAQDTRPPTPQEHARWAGLPIPPEPPPPPPPPPSILDAIWDRITQYSGQTFKLIRGGQFTYRVEHGTVSIDSRNMRFSWDEVAGALTVWPVTRPSQLPGECGRAISHIWALLADERVLGLRHPGTGSLVVDTAPGADPFAPAPQWLTVPDATPPRPPLLIADLFDPTPDRWRRRGDAFLWEFLRYRWRNTEAPKSTPDLWTAVTNGFEEVVGVDPLDRNASESVYVRELWIEDGDTSDCYVDIGAWRDIWLPALVGRSIARSSTQPR